MDSLFGPIAFGRGFFPCIRRQSRSDHSGQKFNNAMRSVAELRRAASRTLKRVHLFRHAGRISTARTRAVIIELMLDLTAGCELLGRRRVPVLSPRDFNRAAHVAFIARITRG